MISNSQQLYCSDSLQIKQKYQKIYLKMTMINKSSIKSLNNDKKNKGKVQFQSSVYQYEYDNFTQSQQLQQIGRSTFVVNDSLITTFNPKRTSMDLNAFIQVFRKKMRQTTITREYQNSIDKFKYLALNKNNRNKKSNGFVGSFKKKNDVQIQNNIIDSKIKKIIISDTEYKNRKDKNNDNNQQQRLKGYSRNQNHRKVLTQVQKQENRTDRLTTKQNESIQSQQNNKNHEQSRNTSTIFTNGRLQKITAYHKPNMIYNISLYRKRNSFNALINKKKQMNLSKNDKKLSYSRSQRQTCQ